MDVIQAQRDHYQKIARDYDDRYNRQNSNHFYKIDQIADAVVRNLKASPDGFDVLELGGGTGIHAQRFLQRNLPGLRSFTLSDLSSEMLQQARKKLGEYPVNYLVSPAETIATTDMFDAIYVSGAMHHFSNPRKSIESMRERLRPGGVVVICEPVVWNPVNFIKAAIDRLEWGQFRVTRNNIEKALRETGFNVRESRVLHWRGPNRMANILWPHERLERIEQLNPLAVMFLLVATK